MTTLYKPVLIESAEQAEALPEGTIAFEGDKTGRCMDRTTNYPWQRGRFPTTDLGMVGWTALVPIEVEEVPETFRDRRGQGLNDRRTVYRTPWEEA